MHGSFFRSKMRFHETFSRKQQNKTVLRAMQKEK